MRYPIYRITDPNSDLPDAESTVTIDTRSSSSDDTAAAIRKIMGLDPSDFEVADDLNVVDSLARAIHTGEYYGDDQAHLDLNIDPLPAD